MAVDWTQYKITPSRVYVDELVTFYVNATSTVSSATLTITIYYDYLLSDGSTVNPNSPVTVDTAASPASIVRTHSYDHIGNLTDDDGSEYFVVRIVTTDGLSTQRNTTRVYVVDNAPPSLLKKPEPIISVENGQTKNMSYTVKDWDSDLVDVTWDFGDGSEPALNSTHASPTGVYVNQTHVWYVVPEPGRSEYKVYFNMSVSFVDEAGHTIYSNHTVEISMPFNSEPDYTFRAESLYSAPGQELEFYASAMDVEGDPITWTFVFANETEDYLTEVYHTDTTPPSTTVWQNTSHVFETIGVYFITLYISDALPPYQVDYHNVSQTLSINVSNNRAPGVLANISVSPVEPRINSTIGYVAVTFSIQANDPDGDVLSLSWSFGDGDVASNTSAGGIQVFTFRQVHNYDVAGPYNVSVLVDDNHGHTVLRYKTVSILTDNRAPRLVSIEIDVSNGVFALPGSTVNITLTLSDAERNPITVWVDYGDNTSIQSVYLADFTVDNTVSTLLSHVYNRTGEYNITINFSDGFYGPTHNVTVGLEVDVRYPRSSTSRVWNWWDYTSLGLVWLGVGLIFLRWYLIGRFRKYLDTKGMTLEEYQVIVKELREHLKSSLKSIDRQVKANKLDPPRAYAMKVKLRQEYAKSREELRAGKRITVDVGA